MTNTNKINFHQKNLMGEYMKEHPSLAKNLIPNCAQGKCTATRLWEELAKKLNAVGPPIKEGKMWKKVFADQKYQAKKKLSFNKLSKKRTGGGPYEEKPLTQAEEQIVEASGLEVAVEGLQVKKFGNPELCQRTSTPLIDFVDSYQAEEPTEVLSDTIFEGAKENVSPPKSKKRKSPSQDPKLSLLQENLRETSKYKKKIDWKLDRLLEIQERLLQIKEEKHERMMALTEIQLQIETRKLEQLKK